MKPSPRDAKTSVDTILETADGSLLDLVDNLLNKGVVVTGEVMLGLAGIDLVYVRLSALLCAADRVFPDTRKGTRS
jgi:gas vesicle protein GvpA/GvpJ/GvpM family